MGESSSNSVKADPSPEEEHLAIFNDFSRLGLLPTLTEGLAEQEISSPTPVQKALIPRVLAGENMVMAASTGSGKTLAYLLPLLQLLHAQEAGGYERRPQRPRVLVLVPTRELARQVLGEIKALSHFSRVSSTGVLGGEPSSLQKKALARAVDVVVCSPGRLLQHKQQGNVFLSHVRHVVIDEVDTMLTQGFGADIRAILRGAMTPRSSSSNGPSERNVQLLMATATLTKAVKSLVDDVQGFDPEFADPSNKTPEKQSKTHTDERSLSRAGRVQMKVVEVDGTHRSLPNVRHELEEVGGRDKLQVLQDVLRLKGYRNSGDPATDKKAMVFCNTISSARAVALTLVEAGVPNLSYHGEMSSKERELNMALFREGPAAQQAAQQAAELDALVPLVPAVLVCTDIAARGIDVAAVSHVVLFDFPLNPVDYLHRAGRTGRAGCKGLVTALVTKRDKVRCRVRLDSLRSLPSLLSFCLS
jgi:superfamily II DNA/RNA helicase